MLNLDIFKHNNNFTQVEIDDILADCKPQNKKYLSQILSIKGIGTFEANYILNSINLSQEKIYVINQALFQYFQRKEINENETYSNYLFNLINNLKTQEHNFLNNLSQNPNKITIFIDNLIEQTTRFFNSENKTSYAFLKIYQD